MQGAFHPTRRMRGSLTEFAGWDDLQALLVGARLALQALVALVEGPPAERDAASPARLPGAAPPGSPLEQGRLPRLLLRCREALPLKILSWG